ncbi:MAG: MerR family transcriptional regulator [Oscillospiraceae bacterium]|nr:MerR family transcriptional regulator [Oscillospiraceae bacterium]
MLIKTYELAICTEVSTNTLREYSDMGLLGPVPRREGSRYRCFDPRLIPQVYLVKALREIGFTSQQLRDYGQNRSPEKALEMFRRGKDWLSDEIKILQDRADMLQSYVDLIEEGQSAVPGEIKLRRFTERRVRCSPIGIDGDKKKNLEYLQRAHGRIRQDGNACCPLGYGYTDFLDLLEKPEQPQLLVSYDPQGPELLPAGEYLTGIATCYYGEPDNLARRMFQYALQNDLEFHGTTHSIYLLDTASVTGAEQHLMRITAQVRRAEGFIAE